MNRNTITSAAKAANTIGTLVKQSRKIVGNVRSKAIAGAKATNKVVNENPYKAIGIAVGVGALLGFLFAGRGARKSE